MLTCNANLYRCSSLLVVALLCLTEEITGLRAQLLAASGEPDMNNPEMIEIQRAAFERFRKPGAIKVFDEREVKLVSLEKSLIAKEILAAQLLPEIARLRLECRLFADQVARDKVSRRYVVDDKRERIDRWAEENDRREQAKIDRLKRDQERLERARLTVNPPISSTLYRPAIASQWGAAASQRMVDDEAVEAVDDDDE